MNKSAHRGFSAIASIVLVVALVALCSAMTAVMMRGASIMVSEAGEAKKVVEMGDVSAIVDASGCRVTYPVNATLRPGESLCLNGSTACVLCAGGRAVVYRSLLTGSEAGRSSEGELLAVERGGQEVSITVVINSLCKSVKYKVYLNDDVVLEGRGSESKSLKARTGDVLRVVPERKNVLASPREHVVTGPGTYSFALICEREQEVAYLNVTLDELCAPGTIRYRVRAGEDEYELSRSAELMFSKPTTVEIDVMWFDSSVYRNVYASPPIIHVRPGDSKEVNIVCVLKPKHYVQIDVSERCEGILTYVVSDGKVRIQGDRSKTFGPYDDLSPDKMRAEVSCRYCSSASIRYAGRSDLGGAVVHRYEVSCEPLSSITFSVKFDEACAPETLAYRIVYNACGLVREIVDSRPRSITLALNGCYNVAATSSIADFSRRHYRDVRVEPNRILLSNGSEIWVRCVRNNIVRIVMTLRDSEGYDYDVYVDGRRCGSGVCLNRTVELERGRDVRIRIVLRAYRTQCALSWCTKRSAGYWYGLLVVKSDGSHDLRTLYGWMVSVDRGDAYRVHHRLDDEGGLRVEVER